QPAPAQSLGGARRRATNLAYPAPLARGPFGAGAAPRSGRRCGPLLGYCRPRRPCRGARWCAGLE
nr:hypothetical protein [Tanacetum cinerariifolium]